MYYTSYVQRFRSPLTKKFEIFRSHANVQICCQRIRPSNSTTSSWYPTSLKIRTNCFHEGWSQQRSKSITQWVFYVFNQESLAGLKKIKMHLLFSKDSNPKTTGNKNTIFSICLHHIDKPRLIFYWAESKKFTTIKK